MLSLDGTIHDYFHGLEDARTHWFVQTRLYTTCVLPVCCLCAACVLPVNSESGGVLLAFVYGCALHCLGVPVYMKICSPTRAASVLHPGWRDCDHSVRFVGDPAQRIQEDYLRIMRYFR